MKRFPLLAAPLLALPVFAQDVTQFDPGQLAGAFFVNDPNQANLSVQMLVQSGEGDQTGIEGLPHYLEHLVWFSVGEDHPIAQGSGSNAFTSQWVTGYDVSVEPSQFGEAIDALMAVFNTPKLDQEFMVAEIDIIAQEFEARQDGTDVEQIFEDSRRWLYADAHTDLPQNVARNVLGELSDIEKFTVEDAVGLHAQTHLPDQAILLIRGSAVPDTLAAILAEKIGTGGTFTQRPRPEFITPPVATQRFETLDDRGAGARFGLRKIIDVGQGLDPLILEEALTLTTIILNGTRDESLATPLYYDEFLVADINLNASLVDEDTMAMIIVAEPEPGVAYDELEPRILRALQDIAVAGISQDTIDKTRDLILRQRATQTSVDAAFGPLARGLRGRQDIVPWVIRNEALISVTRHHVNTLVKQIAAEARTAIIDVRTPAEASQ